jgi:pimeloyl-ACP methyl ester carboxylesterase
MSSGFTKLAFTLVLTALAACNEPAPQTAAGSSNAALSPGNYSFTTEDGNDMPYTVSGGGEVTVLLVHCWMCDRTFWSEQVPILAEHYRTVAVDLPGHGEASADRDHWTLSAFGDDVAGLIEELELSNIVLVGHSMGGPVSLRTAALAGDRVLGIVAVDTLHDAEFDFPVEQLNSMVAALNADFEKTCGDFVQQMFPEEGAEAAMNHVLDSSCNEERKVAGTALMKDFGDVDMRTWFSESGVPVRAINAAAPNPTRVETNRKYADFDVALVENVGHYLHMTRPGQFNPLLLDAIREILDLSPPVAPET